MKDYISTGKFNLRHLIFSLIIESLQYFKPSVNSLYARTYQGVVGVVVLLVVVVVVVVVFVTLGCRFGI